MLYIGLVLAFLTVVFIILGLYVIIFSKRSKVLNRLDLFVAQEEAYEDVQDISFREFIINIIGSVGNRVSRKNYMYEKRRKLNQAYVFMKVEEFIGISLITACISFLFIFYLSKKWYIAFFGVFLGYKLPDIYIESLKKKRMKKLNSQLPEALSIISNGLRAGFSFTQAMNVAANEMDTPIRDEFLRVVRDNAIGKTMDEALEAFSERTDDDDIDMLITALIIQRKVGGNLAEVLDTIGETIRDRMRIRGEVKTLTAQGRMSATVISILPFAVAIFIFIMNPSYIMELFRSTIGIFMVIGALVGQVLGIFIIIKMANIEI